MFTPGIERSVEFTFDALLAFDQGDTPLPTADELYSVMERANYVDYVTQFVWNSEPVGATMFNNVDSNQYFRDPNQ